MTYISTADTAKLVRKALKDAFPDTKFYVNSSSYAGGASISVSWVDGPTDGDVNAVTAPFRGASFDSSQDLLTYVGGVHPSTGEKVSYGADYIHARRSFSAEFYMVVVDRLASEWGWGDMEYDPHTDYLTKTKTVESVRPRFNDTLRSDVIWRTIRVARPEDYQGDDEEEVMELSSMTPTGQYSWLEVA